VLDGAEAGDEAVVRAAAAAQEHMQQMGAHVRRLSLAGLDIKPCLGCFGCWVRNPGVCVVKDDAETVSRALISSDLVFLVGRITYGGYPAPLKKAFDRSICLVSPLFVSISGETHHRARYGRYPMLVGVGVLDSYDFDQVAVFRDLLERNALNFHSPAHVAVVVTADETAEDVKSALADGLYAMTSKGV